MLIDELHAALPQIKNIKERWPLAPLCTLHVGGEAEIFVAPDSLGDLRELFYFLSKEKIPTYVLGGGSNVLFHDGLIKGVVISTENLNSIEWRTNITADVDAGFKMPLLMKELREKNLAGMEFMAGIPGTLGGAIMGNAGAGGRGICELLDYVLAVEADGSVKMWNYNEIDHGYRRCSLANDKRVIVSARMTFRIAKHGDKEVLENFLLRRGTQPHGLHNAGCTFKNPEGNSAGKLLDECGCKNLSFGDAVVSDVHANFILNRGNATADDIIKLIEICAKRVYENTGIKLEPEIKIIDPCFHL
ncbi:MAG: UDP-N-acetylmuramate dehydrogenase [Synergistaceae bacterium]|nr:UDP-N-acetylmuramate dehydrogenase [Synergistaceae bacterium]